MADIAALAEQIQGLTLMEAADLVKDLEDKLGVSAAAPVAMAAAPVAGGEAAEEEQTEFTVTLKAVGPNKIKVIKAVREATSLGLKEAKGLVDEAPKAIKEGIAKDEADALMKTFEEVGAEVALS